MKLNLINGFQTQRLVTIICLNKNGQTVSSVKNAAIPNTGSVLATFIFAPKCEHHHSLIAGTIMDSSKKPITYWFKAMWWFTTRKSGINAVNLKELLGFGSYGTAWCWLQKLRRCTIRQDREKLSGRVEVDEFSLAAKDQANEAAVPGVKQSSRSPLKDETWKSEWVAFVCMSPWIARHIR
jgi:hypothetical protein